jgi:hypothetical protein
VIHSVEKLFEVEVHDIPVATRQLFLGGRYRLMCRPPGPKAVAVVGKRWVEDGLKHLQHRLLDKSVEGGGHAQFPHPTIGLWYLDTRQHHAVEAGRPYHQLQEAGVQTVRLDAIVRQQDPALKEAVEHLARGEIRTAVEQLRQQGRVHEFKTRDERLGAIAQAFAQDPQDTLVVAPDHRSRRDLNDRIRALLQRAGQVRPDDHRLRILEARQEVTGADRQWAEQYARGDVVRYTTGSRTLGFRAGEYARIAEIDAANNRVTVVKGNGESRSYDPRRLQGVTIFRDTERAFAAGDRVQFTAPFRDRQVANRELGTLERIDATGRVRVRLEAEMRPRPNV